MTETILDLNQAGPVAIDHVIGQRRAVLQLRTALDAHVNDRAAARGGNAPALPHILLVGPPGLGKSTLAQIVAREIGGTLHEELAQNVLIPSHLHGLMLLAEPYDAVFLDEIHELHVTTQTTLYRCLEERRLFLPSTPDGRRQSIELPPFTFLGATTDEWAITKPLRDRFKIVVRLDYYSEDELTEVVAQRARRLGWTITDAAVRGIASRGRGTPRLALRLLEATRRTARAQGAMHLTVDHLRRTCEIEGIDRLGLDALEQRYLAILRQAGGPVRLNVLATRLGLPRLTIERIVESDLIRLGLVVKDNDGRVLTAEGLQHVRA